jgi:hypothetical protein
MKNLILIAVLVYGTLTSAQVKGQSTGTTFKDELTRFVDSTVNASGKGLKKLDRFEAGCYSHVKEKKFGEPVAPYTRSVAHSHNITSYTDKDGNGNINPEKYGIKLTKEIYESKINKILNDPNNVEANYDSYYFTIVNIKGSYYLVFAMGYLDPVDSDEKLNAEFNKAMETTN